MRSCFILYNLPFFKKKKKQNTDFVCLAKKILKVLCKSQMSSKMRMMRSFIRKDM